MVDEPTLTLKEVAENLRVNLETARRLVSSGRIRGFKPAGVTSGWRVRRSALDRYITERENEAAREGADR